MKRRQIADTPTTQVSWSDIEDLETRYSFRGVQQVHFFLSKYPFLIPVLQEAHTQIKHYFPSALTVLEVSNDPDTEDDGNLVARITTDLPSGQAMETLDRLDDEWWLSAMDRTHDRLSINIDVVASE